MLQAKCCKQNAAICFHYSLHSNLTLTDCNEQFAKKVRNFFFKKTSLTTKWFFIPGEEVQASPSHSLVGIISQPATFFAFTRAASKAFSSLKFVVIFTRKRCEITFWRYGICEKFVGSSMIAQVSISACVICVGYNEKHN